MQRVDVVRRGPSVKLTDCPSASTHARTVPFCVKPIATLSVWCKRKKKKKTPMNYYILFLQSSLKGDDDAVCVFCVIKSSLKSQKWSPFKKKYEEIHKNQAWDLHSHVKWHTVFFYPVTTTPIEQWSLTCSTCLSSLVRDKHRSAPISIFHLPPIPPFEETRSVDD